MDTAASCRLLSPASSSPPPCPKQLPKRRPTFAASQQQSPSSSAKFRLLCLLHDKVHSRLVASNLGLDATPSPPMIIPDRPCSWFVSCLLLERTRSPRRQRRRCRCRAHSHSCRGWRRCCSAEPSGQLYVQESLAQSHTALELDWTLLYLHDHIYISNVKSQMLYV
jgi:hypothetical protein